MAASAGEPFRPSARRTSVILLVGGPSGAGKSALIRLAVESFGMRRLVALTTRARRTDEVAGVDYDFVDRDAFRMRIVGGTLTDWDYTVGNFYGYGLELQEAAHKGEPVAVAVVSRMAVRLARRLPNTVLLSLDGPDPVLDSRMGERRTGADELVLRRAHRTEERDLAPLFDVVVGDAATMTRGETEALLQSVLRP